MDLNLPPHLFYGLILYAETHYAFRYLGSILKKREPEILADAPTRVEPGAHLPVLCIIKDASLYPVQLTRIVVTVEYPSGHIAEHTFSFHIKVEERLWYKILDIMPQEQGTVIVDVAFYIRRKGKEHVIHNDNYRTASHAALRVYVSPETLPKAPGWYYGEPHCHTIYSADQVEFGAPVAATVDLAQAMGLHWMVVTDHSYDLDDQPDNPLQQDPALPLWHQMKAEVDRANRAYRDFVAIAGEEVSCGNEKGRNVHLLALGIDRFIEGAGDSAERWPYTRPEWTVGEVIEKIIQDGGLAYAAHPAERTRFLQWLLIRRGQWSTHDLTHPMLAGLQIWNGDRNPGLQTGRSYWIQLLLEGHRKYILGGNDAHGNFNRFRQIGIPFLSIREAQRQLFGRVRTGLFTGGKVTKESVLSALHNGQSVITDGPFTGLSLKNDIGHEAVLGQSIRGHTFVARIEGSTSEEFGEWEEIILYQGDLQRREETTPVRFDGAGIGHTFIREVSIAVPRPGYIRIEAQTRKGHLCMTNPVWIAL